jgi:hypothetical protein
VVGPLLVGGCDFDDVAVDDFSLQRYPATVDSAAYAGVTDLGVDPICKIEDSSATWKREDITARSETINLVRVEIDFE